MTLGHGDRGSRPGSARSASIISRLSVEEQLVEEVPCESGYAPRGPGRGRALEAAALAQCPLDGLSGAPAGGEGCEDGIRRRETGAGRFHGAPSGGGSGSLDAGAVRVLSGDEELARTAQAVIQIAPITSTMPATSAADGHLAEQHGPHHRRRHRQQREHHGEAVAGERRIANCSSAYGTTLDSPRPRRRAPRMPGSRRRARCATRRAGRATIAPNARPTARPSCARSSAARGEAVAEHDVAGPQRPGGERLARPRRGCPTGARR